MDSTLLTSWDLRSAAGEPSATVHLQNLSSTITGPQDAWGRPRRPQPISISAEVSLAHAFSVSSSGDVVDVADTVHYGLLSKEILRILPTLEGDVSLAAVVGALCRRLTGVDLNRPTVQGSETAESFLAEKSVRCVHVTVLLPKASLLGGGVSLSGSVFIPGGRVESRAVTLTIHDLRIPTLIGVNDNERMAEQMVSTTVEIGRWLDIADGYTALEQVVTKSMRDSSFETLEALARKLCVKLYEYLRANHQPPPDPKGWRLRVSLEKPIAVPLADAPRVELSIDSCHLDDAGVA